MRTIKDYSQENLVRLFNGEDTDKYDGCVVSQGTVPCHFCLPSFRLKECLMLLCVKGELHVDLNGEEQTLLPHSLWVCPAGSIVRVECMQAASFVCVIPSTDYLIRNYNYWKLVLPLIMELGMKHKNVIPLAEAEAVELERMADCVMECLQDGRRTEWMCETLASGVRMLVCAILGKMKNVTAYKEKVQVKKCLSRCDDYFSRFMKLLAIHYREEREVAFYASKLCVTPKYFSTMVKKASGKSPGKWIDEVVMEEIHYLLKNSNISIKEIAYQLNFANVSFFGKFVKRHVGLSPYHYRTDRMVINPALRMDVV